jgi:coenzyme F420-reducing hydrogenase delta subunit
MLPPSFIDFALSRDLADGVVLSGCAEGDCYYRLGDDWVQQRLNRERDPYLRNRVDRNRVGFWRFRPSSHGKRTRALAEFRDTLADMPKSVRGRRAGNE